MLWKKESKRKNALYIDLMAQCDPNLESDIDQIISIKGTKPITQKSNEIALQKRKDGNLVFRKGAYDHAMELYNESLCFAEPGSVDVSLAFANRSSCFLNMSMYHQCLQDIELAIASGYPETMRSKLEERREVCFKRLESGMKPRVIDEKLHFKRDRKFPYMAELLKIKRDDYGKYSVVAKDDIDVDRTVVVEKSFRTFLSKRFGLKCNICLKGFTNLVPCDICAVAMFCYECQGHFLHEYECGLNICGPSAINNDVMYAVRDILMTISMFPSIDELNSFIERIKKSDINELPLSLKDSQSKYEVFFKSVRRSESDSIHSMAFWIYPVCRTIFKIPKIQAMFKTKRHLRFLQHLISHHSLVSVSNARFGLPTALTNVLSIAGDGRSVFITTKPIKRGEQIFISHIPICIEPTEFRQKFLRDQTGLACNCTRCKNICATAVERMEMAADPSFHFIMTHKSCEGTYKEIEESIQQCAMFLRTYGRLKWSDELMAVLGKYQSLLHTRVAGNTHNPRFYCKLLSTQRA